MTMLLKITIRVAAAGAATPAFHCFAAAAFPACKKDVGFALSYFTSLWCAFHPLSILNCTLLMHWTFWFLRARAGTWVPGPKLEKTSAECGHLDCNCNKLNCCGWDNLSRRDKYAFQSSSKYFQTTNCHQCMYSYWALHQTIYDQIWR